MSALELQPAFLGLAYLIAQLRVEPPPLIIRRGQQLEHHRDLVTLRRQAFGPGFNVSQLDVRCAMGSARTLGLGEEQSCRRRAPAEQAAVIYERERYQEIAEDHAVHVRKRKNSLPCTFLVNGGEVRALVSETLPDDRLPAVAVICRRRPERLDEGIPFRAPVPDGYDFHC